jgi:hypothetical protein
MSVHPSNRRRTLTRRCETEAVQIAEERAHQALAYVDAVARHGYTLSVEEFDAYVARPARRQESMPAFDQLARSIRISFVGATKPGETVLAWLVRLRWLTSDADRVFITPLGRAVLEALNDQSREEELDAEIVLDPDDELAYPRLIGAITAVGEGATLVDAYFSIDYLLHIVHRTGVARVLVRPGANNTERARVSALGQAVEQLQIPRRFEVRSSTTIHDRWVIPATGPVMFLGTSLSGVGKRLTVAGHFAEGPTSDAVRAQVEKAWKPAEVVALSEPEPEPEPELTEDAKDVEAAAPPKGKAKPASNAPTRKRRPSSG